MSAESQGGTSDVEVSFTRHAIHRLRERFGVALDEMKKLIHNFFNFESFSVSGQTNWMMIVPLRYCFIGTFEGNCFVVKTVFFNINQGTRRFLGEVKRLRISDVNYPTLPESSYLTDTDSGRDDEFF